MDVVNLDDLEWIDDRTCGRFKLLYESDNCSLVYFEVMRPTIPHRHERMIEMYFIVSGRGTVRVRDESINVRAGRRLIIPRGAIHQIAPETDRGVIKMYVLADPKFDPSDVIEEPGYYDS